MDTSDRLFLKFNYALIVLSISFLLTNVIIIKFLGGLFIVCILPFLPLSYALYKKINLLKIEIIQLSILFSFVFIPIMMILISLIKFSPEFILLSLILFNIVQTIYFLLRYKKDLDFRIRLSSISLFFDKYFYSIILIFTYTLFVSIPLINVGSENPEGDLLKPFTLLNTIHDSTFPKIFSMDFLKHVAFTNELSRGDYPPKNPFFVSEQLHYYWFYSSLVSSIYLITDLNQIEVLRYFSIFLLIVFLFLIFTVLKKNIKNDRILFASLLILTFFNSYEYVNMFLTEKNISLYPGDILNFYVSKLTENGGEKGNIEYYITFVQATFQKYYWYLPHAIIGIYIFLWISNLYLNNRTFGAPLNIFVGYSLATVIMYNSYIFIISFIVYFFMLFTKIRQSQSYSNILPSVFLLFFIFSIFNFISIFYLILVLFLLVLEFDLKKITNHYVGVICCILFALLFFYLFIHTDATSQLIRYTQGGWLNPYVTDNNPLRSYVANNHNFFITNFFFIMFSFPFLLYVFNKKTYLKLKFLILSFLILLIFLINYPSFENVIKFENIISSYTIKQWSKNLFGLFLIFLEVGPGIIFISFAFFYQQRLLGFIDENLLKILMLGSLLPILLLNTFNFGPPTFDFFAKISTFNFIFIAMLGGIGMYALLTSIENKNLKEISLFSISLLLLLSLPNFIGDVYWHTNTSGTTQQNDFYIKDICKWIHGHTDKRDIIQQYPFSASYDIASFCNRRTVIGDFMSASFMLPEERVRKISNEISQAFEGEPSTAYDVFRRYRIDYIWISRSPELVEKFKKSSLFSLSYENNYHSIFKIN